VPVTVRCPTRLAEALAALADTPGAEILAGGTDLMVEVNHGSRRPEAIVAVGRVAELRGWAIEDGATLRIGAATTYTDLLAEDVAALAPALAAASRTVGSPQIRNAGTIGGNLATASPAGDTLPVLVALDAEVELASAHGVRRLPVAEFITGPKRTSRAPGELLVAVRIPAASPGDGQEYLKVGTRNAMVIAVASCAVIVDRASRRVSVGLGSVGPRPLRAPAAEAWAADHVDWATGEVDDPTEFGRLVAAAASPIDDHRSTAAYRRHAIGVLAARGLRRGLGGTRGAAA
jgi:CO/xanthine dehydrogenase FAD-binding subunit